MTGTPIMNSPDLQNVHYDDYKKFFNSHDLVLSSHAVLTWGVDVSHGISAIKIKQKLPTRIFCWANFNASGKVSIRKISKFVTSENAFVEESFPVAYRKDFERIFRFLEDFLAENGCKRGLDIDFLTETPQWHGFSFSGVISVLLSTIFFMATEKLAWDASPECELPHDWPMFNEVYRFSLRIANCISRGKSIGSSNYASMLPDTPLPIVFLSKKNIAFDKKAISESDGAPDEILYRDSLLSFLWIAPEDAISEFPLDYWVIFMGMEYDFSEIESVRDGVYRRNDQLDSFVHHMLQTLPILDDDRDTLLKLLNTNENETFQKSIEGTNLKILEGFDYLFKSRFSDRSVSVFINTIQNIGSTSFAYQDQNRFFSAIQYLFYQFRQFDDEEIGMLPFNNGKNGWSMLFVMKHRKSRATLEKVLFHLREDGHKIFLDYASWRDGYASGWVRLEQFVTQKVFSKFTIEGNVQFADSNGNSYCGEYDRIIEDERDCMLLDTIKRRIYLRGTKLTSKEIHSQNTTIDMLTLLVKNLGKEVSNGKLPVSTYSQNKNEILSKVVLPLRKLAKECFWKEMLLTCSGGITDYYLRLENDPQIRIGTISKIGN